MIGNMEESLKYKCATDCKTAIQKQELKSRNDLDKKI